MDPQIDPAAVHRLRLSLNRVSVAVYPAGATFGPRTLGDFEFVWIEDGDAVWQVDGAELPAPQGTLLLGRPGMRDGFTWDRVRPTTHGFIHFSIESGRDLLPPFAAWPMTCQLGAGDILQPLLRHIGWLQRREGGAWPSLAEGALRQVLLAFIAGASGQVVDRLDEGSPIVERVMEHVRRAWAQGRLGQPSLVQLARVAGVSRGHLVRVFRDEFGVGPAEAMRLLRLDRAAFLLARSNLDVQEVAAQTGFADPFHFSRRFSATYGHSPRAFRRRCAAGVLTPVIRLVRVRRLSERMWVR